jgi:CDP-diacylglycerol--serine O-phosphatidyltransferase
MIKELKLKDYVTLMGTLCAIVSIVFSLEKIPVFAAFFITLANIMDTLDGYIARKMNQINEIGKELDSLSDGISFGVAPAVLVYSFFAPRIGFLKFTVYGIELSYLIIPCAIFIFAAIIRLAWFNIEKGEGYTGLPTPISAGFVVACVLLSIFWRYPVQDTILSTVISYMMPFVLILLAIFNVAPFLMFGKTVRKKTGIAKILLILIAFLTIIAWMLSFTYSTPIWDITMLVIIGIISFVLLLGVIYIAFGIKGYINYRKVNKTSENQI